MHVLSETILAEYQVRKTTKQKLAFIELLRRHLPELKVEESSVVHNRNIVIGDVDRAELVLTAHYDTCAALPFPNLIFPKNLLFTILYSLIIVIPFFIVMALCRGILELLTDSFWVKYFASVFVFFALFVGIFFLGRPNKHTANDNTSGVIMLTELYFRLSPELKEKVAFVFFDNEENGLLGSAYFSKLHKKQMKDKLLINFDCVSDGDNIMLVLSKKAIKLYGEKLKAAYISAGGKTVLHESSAKVMYPSDQSQFPLGVAAAALHKKPFWGYYLGRIHTARDTVFDLENIELLCSGTERLLQTFHEAGLN